VVLIDSVKYACLALQHNFVRSIGSVEQQKSMLIIYFINLLAFRTLPSAATVNRSNDRRNNQLNG